MTMNMYLEFKEFDEIRLLKCFLITNDNT